MVPAWIESSQSPAVGFAAYGGEICGRSRAFRTRGRRQAICGGGRRNPHCPGTGCGMRPRSDRSRPRRVAEAGLTSSGRSERRGRPERGLPHPEHLDARGPRGSRSGRAGRPVMVWIHGGGFTSGSGSVFLYRGGQLARHGDVVVVTINYRLGALGFLGHPGLGDPDGFVGNWGLHDQVAALRWVRDHIAQFGGDPDRVTIFGESAGGFSVAALMARAGGGRSLPARRGAERRRARAHRGGSRGARPTAWRRRWDCRVAPVTRWVRSRPPSWWPRPTRWANGRPDPGALAVPFLPVVDGAFLPQHPLRAVEQGAAAGVDLLIGTNRDELTLFSLGRPELMALDEARALQLGRQRRPGCAGDRTAERLSRGAHGAGGGDRPSRAHGRHRHRRRLSLAQPPAGRGPAGAWGADLRLPVRVGVARPSVECSGRAMPWSSPSSSGWCMCPPCSSLPEAASRSRRCRPRCSRPGSPSPAHGDPTHAALEGGWPAWDPRKRTTMVFGRQTGAIDGPRNAELAVWERYRPLFSPPVLLIRGAGRRRASRRPPTPRGSGRGTATSRGTTAPPAGDPPTVRPTVPRRPATRTALPASASHTTVPGTTADVIAVSRRDRADTRYAPMPSHAAKRRPRPSGYRVTWPMK